MSLAVGMELEVNLRSPFEWSPADLTVVNILIITSKHISDSFSD